MMLSMIPATASVLQLDSLVSPGCYKQVFDTT